MAIFISRYMIYGPPRPPVPQQPRTFRYRVVRGSETGDSGFGTEFDRLIRHRRRSPNPGTRGRGNACGHCVRGPHRACDGPVVVAGTLVRVRQATRSVVPPVSPRKPSLAGRRLRGAGFSFRPLVSCAAGAAWTERRPPLAADAHSRRGVTGQSAVSSSDTGSRRPPFFDLRRRLSGRPRVGPVLWPRIGRRGPR